MMKITILKLKKIIKESFNADAVMVDINEEETEAVRARWNSFEGITVAKFVSAIGLYRVIDEFEYNEIMRTGKVTGGNYAVKAERSAGASWGNNIDDVIKFGLMGKKNGRLVGQLRVLKIDGFDRNFLHLDPEIMNGMMSKAKCSIGLGCSVKDVGVEDLDEVWILRDDGNLIKE